MPLTGLYPFMKRITYFPQVWLGLKVPLILRCLVLTCNFERYYFERACAHRMCRICKQGFLGGDDPCFWRIGVRDQFLFFI